MLKRLTICLLIFAVTAANFSCAFIFFGFKTNQSYITKNICINRFRPRLHCNGKCYLMRKIRQAAENEKKQDTKDGALRQEVSFCEEAFRIIFPEPHILTTQNVYFPNYTRSYSNRFKGAIFKPPPLV